MSMAKSALAVAAPPPPPTLTAQVHTDVMWLQTIKELAPTVGIEGVKELMTMRREERAQAAKSAFLAAFSDLQAVLPAVARKGKGHNDKKYARFEDFIAGVKGPMAAHGFSLSFRLHHEEGKIRIVGVLGHRAGHEESTELPLPADTTGNKNAVQAWGSAISYGKRYVGMTLLGIAAEDEDDDGRKAGAIDAGAALTDDQIGDLQKLITSTKTNVGNFLKIIGAESLSDIPQTKFDVAKRLLEVKRGAQ